MDDHRDRDPKENLPQDGRDGKGINKISPQTVQTLALVFLALIGLGAP